MVRGFFFFIALFLLAFATPAVAAEGSEDEAARHYQNLSPAVYQVQVINLSAGKKTSIGSGFQVTADGKIATNYHVIAEAVHRPDQNRIEFVNDRGETGALRVLAVDVPNDLALVLMDAPGDKFLSLNTAPLKKGVRIFSLGNPHDIGFTIVEGNYNGLIADSFSAKIHFSGAINPGMSGGPAVDHLGRVVGVNVATAGNQIGFLVPAVPLEALLQNAGKTPVTAKTIEAQLTAMQEKNLAAVLLEKWEETSFGPVRVPGKIHDAIKCWGGRSNKEKDPYIATYTTCSSQDQVFLDNDFDTGMITYRYDYIVPEKEMDRIRFYALYESFFENLPGGYRNGGEDHVTNFDCVPRFLTVAGKTWKSNLCLRRYKKYPGMYDLHLYMAMLSDKSEGLTAALVMQGVAKGRGLDMVKAFLGHMTEGQGAPAP